MKNIQDEFFDKTLLCIIDDAEKKFTNDKKIQDKIKELLDEINKSQNAS